MSTHTCTAIVVACIDFRFQNHLETWAKNTLSGKTYDRVGWAGSTKSLEAVIAQIAISKRLHEITEAYLIHHEDCGAYGAEGSRERHAADLAKASDAIHAQYPDITVHTLYMRLDGVVEEV